MTELLKSTLASLLESFFYQRLMAQRRASPATVNAYRDAWRLFLIFVSERVSKPPCQLSLQELDRDVVLAFLDHLELERNNTVSTRNVRLAAIRSFFQYVAYFEPAAMNFANRVLSIESKKTTRRLMDYLREDELDAILDATDQSVPQGRRDYALLLFLARTGARVSEAIGVNVGDLQLQRPSCVLIRGKGAKERMVPLAKDIAPVIKSLLHERGVTTDSQSPVFVNSRDQRLTRQGVTHIIHRAVAVAAKIIPPLSRKAISPHTLRHYLPSLTMSSDIGQLSAQSGNSAHGADAVSESPDIVFSTPTGC